MGFEDQDILVDVLTICHHDLTVDSVSENAFENYQIAKHLNNYYHGMNDLEQQTRAYPNV